MAFGDIFRHLALFWLEEGKFRFIAALPVCPNI
jgi:hypothetical protein